MIRHKGGAGYGKGYNPHPSAAPDTHTVRDDSGMSTQAMTERRAKRDAASAAAPHSGYVNPDGSDAMGPKKPNIKIGAQYETWHEPDSPEGSAILKDKAGKAKAIKKVNKKYGKEYGKDDTVQARSESYDRAKKDEAQWGDMAGPGSPSQTYKEGGSKAEIAKNQSNNRQRIQNEKDGYK